MAVQVGKPAPDFETKGYVQGEIKTVKLSDYRGLRIWPSETRAAALNHPV